MSERGTAAIKRDEEWRKTCDMWRKRYEESEDKLVTLRFKARLLERYAEFGMGNQRDQVAGEWLRRADVLAFVDGLDVLRDGTTKGNTP